MASHHHTEKKRILLNNIYGVDIDPQAVEVTKLSLLLKVLEGESSESLVRQRSMFRERALPDLAQNIKCGNSLVEPDFWNSTQLALIPTDDNYRINVFNWDEAFPEVFGQSHCGFDAVIGNPPYASVPDSRLQAYFDKKLVHQDYQRDLYLLFLELYHRLLRTGGYLGVIVSNTWLQSVTLRSIRKHLATSYDWLRPLHLPDKVFDAVVDTHVLIFQKHGEATTAGHSLRVDVRKNRIVTVSHELPRTEIPKTGEPINIVASVAQQNLIRKIRDQSVRVVDVCAVFNGVKPFERGKGNPPQTDTIMKDKPFLQQGKMPNPDWKPLLRGSLIHRYQNRWNQDYWILYGPWLAAPRQAEIFAAPQKIVVRQTGDSVIATLAEGGVIARDNLHVVLPGDEEYDLRYLLGIMNSRLIDVVYSFANPEKGEALAQVKKHHVEQLTIKRIDPSKAETTNLNNSLIQLVDHMLDSNIRLVASMTQQERSVHQGQIDATDRRIDQIVYKLYGLTQGEIELIETGY